MKDPFIKKINFVDAEQDFFFQSSNICKNIDMKRNNGKRIPKMPLTRNAHFSFDTIIAIIFLLQAKRWDVPPLILRIFAKSAL